MVEHILHTDGVISSNLILRIREGFIKTARKDKKTAKIQHFLQILAVFVCFFSVKIVKNLGHFLGHSLGHRLGHPESASRKNNTNQKHHIKYGLA